MLLESKDAESPSVLLALPAPARVPPFGDNRGRNTPEKKKGSGTNITIYRLRISIPEAFSS
jgi:hypothetical protein